MPGDNPRPVLPHSYSLPGLYVSFSSREKVVIVVWISTEIPYGKVGRGEDDQIESTRCLAALARTTALAA
jgi:hypothetical protein